MGNECNCPTFYIWICDSKALVMPCAFSALHSSVSFHIQYLMYCCIPCIQLVQCSHEATGYASSRWLNQGFWILLFSPFYLICNTLADFSHQDLVIWLLAVVFCSLFQARRMHFVSQWLPGYCQYPLFSWNVPFDSVIIGHTGTQWKYLP